MNVFVHNLDQGAPLSPFLFLSECWRDNRFAKPSPSPSPQGVDYRKIEQNCCVIDILKTPAERRERGNVSGMVDMGDLSSHCDLALLTLKILGFQEVKLLL